jgi:hypothetical protein
LRWKVLTVASSSSSAATMSPLTADLQHEDLAVADELAGEGEHVLDLLGREDGAAGGDPSDEWRRDGLRRGVVALFRVHRARRRLGGNRQLLRQRHDEGPRAVRVAAKEALLLEHLQLMGDRRGRRQPGALRDVADAGRVAVGLHGLADHQQDLDLAWGESGGAGGRELGDAAELGGDLLIGGAAASAPWGGGVFSHGYSLLEGRNMCSI